jgi:hypothetical protein
MLPFNEKAFALAQKEAASILAQHEDIRPCSTRGHFFLFKMTTLLPVQQKHTFYWSVGRQAFLSSGATFFVSGQEHTI